MKCSVSWFIRSETFFPADNSAWRGLRPHSALPCAGAQGCGLSGPFVITHLRETENASEIRLYVMSSYKEKGHSVY